MKKTLLAAAFGAFYLTPLAAQELPGTVPLEFGIEKVHISLHDHNNKCFIEMASLKASQKNPTLILPVSTPCDVMTKGATYNFQIDARGGQGVYLLRVIGGLQWVPTSRAECGMEIADVIVDVKKRTLSLAEPTPYPLPVGFCPRLRNQNLKWP